MLHFIGLKRLASDKHFNLLGPFVSNEENEVLTFTIKSLSELTGHKHATFLPELQWKRKKKLRPDEERECRKCPSRSFAVSCRCRQSLQPKLRRRQRGRRFRRGDRSSQARRRSSKPSGRHSLKRRLWERVVVVLLPIQLRKFTWLNTVPYPFSEWHFSK